MAFEFALFLIIIALVTERIGHHFKSNEREIDLCNEIAALQSRNLAIREAMNDIIIVSEASPAMKAIRDLKEENPEASYIEMNYKEYADLLRETKATQAIEYVYGLKIKVSKENSFNLK